MSTFLTFVILFSFLCKTGTTKDQQQKRLLLNDPDVLADRLGRLESLVTSLSDKLQQEETKRNVLEGTVSRLTKSQKTSSTYIRWGKKICPGNDTLLYTGFIGGGYYDEPGAAADAVCLPPNPDFTKTTASQAPVGHMYGTEFETNFFGPKSFDEDVPCSVCEIQDGTQTFMIPGKNTCFSGWQVKYKGNLGSGYYAHKSATTFICVDESPDYLRSGESNTNGKVLFEVIAKCGALPCPPYHEGYPLTCVVCSK
ncbi:unnamed protein product [Mytilus coruscus]|uniref:Short-chain collagen C4 n=1 Tax=Mytilus coruscus TaxID=42192 RepID=A0A6J8C6C5_MYTCO|nr:unnamed protein product [Mytilus coruscus]